MARLRSALPALLLAFLLLAAPGWSEDKSPAFSETRPRNVVLILVDTLRRDHLGIYGYSRPTSPHIDAFAQDAVRYTSSFSQAPWTTPSIGALLTSQYPSHLGIADVPHGLKDEADLLPEILQRQGYATGAVISHDFLGSKWNFDQGYDEFHEELAQGHRFASSPKVTDRAIEFVERHLEKPFFLVAHYFDPHDQYQRHEGFDFASPLGYRGPLSERVSVRRLRLTPPETIEAADIDFLEALYDSDVAFTDHHIGRLLDHLRKRGLYDDALIIFTADHGEEFFDHQGFGHTATLYKELIHVPLLVHYPGQQEGSVVDRTVGLIDVLPTVLDVLALPTPTPVAGISLRHSDPTSSERIVFSETSRRRNLRAAIRGPLKLILDLETGVSRLFDVEGDPDERHDLSHRRSAEAAVLRAGLEQWLATFGAAASDLDQVDIDAEERERLKPLGYLD